MHKKLTTHLFGSNRQIIYYTVHKKNCVIEDEGLDNSVVAATAHSLNTQLTVL